MPAAPAEQHAAPRLQAPTPSPADAGDHTTIVPPIVLPSTSDDDDGAADER
jgi:hypothetical protein